MIEEKMNNIWPIYDLSGFELTQKTHTHRDDNILLCFNDAHDKLNTNELHWLDLGSGYGSLVNDMLNIISEKKYNTLNSRATFNEPDKASAEKLKEVIKQQVTLKNIDILHDDMNILLKNPKQNLPHQPFNLITAYHVIYHANSWVSFIQQLQEIRAKNGIISIALKSGQTWFYKEMKIAYKKLGMPLPSPFFAENLISILKKENISYSLVKRNSKIIFPENRNKLIKLLRFTWRLNNNEISKLEGDSYFLTNNIKTLAKRSEKPAFTDYHFLL